MYIFVNLFGTCTCICVCVREPVHTWVLGNTILRSEQKASALAFHWLQPPLHQARSPLFFLKFQVPSTSILSPNGPELAFSAYAGLSFRLSCVTSACVCPAQGLAKGYKLKEGAWTWGQKEGRTKWAWQYAFPTLLCSCSENS